MALGFLYTCNCGRRFKAYVPKQKLFGRLTGTTVDWNRIDQREEADGGIDEVRRQADSTQCSFVDARGGGRLRCPSCESEVDLLRHFQMVMANLSRPSRPLIR